MGEIRNGHDVQTRHIFAEPGDEQQWFDENRAKLTEFGLL
jgi:hypothetical protein